ncbi:MAG: hypothetical protein AAF757_00915 [Cyanobacteria bacterium P01_D01_bin.116]
MTESNSTVNTKYRPETLIEKYSIKSSAYYQRIKFLKIKAQKDENNKAYLTGEQVAIMDALHEHVQATGKMQGFVFSSEESKEASELVASATNDVDENAGKMTVSGKGELSQPKPDSVIEQQIPETQPDFSQGMEGLIRQAAEIKAQGLAMPDLIALQLAGQMTFEDLPDDLKNKVTAVQEAANPKMQPVGIANQLLAQYRASRQ